MSLGVAGKHTRESAEAKHFRRYFRSTLELVNIETRHKWAIDSDSVPRVLYRKCRKEGIKKN